MSEKLRTFYFVLLTLLLSISASYAQVPAEKITADEWVEKNESTLKDISKHIWALAELSLQEYESSRTLSDFLARHGFNVETGVAGMPTAFIASYGSGKPVIAILAEYDALPGLSQQAVPEKIARPGAANGHACGHSLFGTASTGAAIATRYAMEKHGLKGTIRLYGCPAEEVGAGKVYMTRAKLFDDCDIALHWHPGDKTLVWFDSTKAIVSVKFNFHGLSAHASLSPHQGKSALDAVELMNIGVNFMREHLPEDARIHYVITDGGLAPNVVPPEAQVWYYLRADKHSYVQYIFQRMIDMAKGAALMTDTTVDWHIETDSPELLPNLPLSQLFQKNLLLVGPPQFTEAEKNFAAKTQKPLKGRFEYALSETIEPLPEEPGLVKASTDVANVSWVVPTSGLRTACYSYGAPGHSWQNTACAGMSIGQKGMIVATRVLAYSAIELLTEPQSIKKAKADFEERREGHEFTSLLPEGQKAPEKIK